MADLLPVEMPPAPFAYGRWQAERKLLRSRVMETPSGPWHSVANEDIITGLLASEEYYKKGI
jgi:hypothetical protein